jgi:hypothetical protein
MSPSFLYLVEPGEDGQVRALDGYELASRLSYTLWKTTPDAELMQAAAAGQLDTKDGIRVQAARLLADPRASRAVRDFYFQWIDGYGIDALQVPEGFDERLRTAAQNEIALLIDDWFSRGTGRVQELFTTRTAFLDGELARFYGAAAPDGETGAVELPASERSGLLTRAVFVGTHGPPSTRGDFILNRVVCSPVPPPPVTPPDPTELGTFNTRREMFEAHADLACARSCHALLDPVGFAFEHYDESGRFRLLDNGFPIDSSADIEIPGADSLNGPVADAIELSARIAEADEVLHCQAEHWFRYAYGRRNAPADRCSLDTLSAALFDSGGSVHDLLRALTQTDAFRFARKEAP